MDLPPNFRTKQDTRCYETCYKQVGTSGNDWTHAEQANKQTSKQAGNQASKQAIKQACKQESKQVKMAKNGRNFENFQNPKSYFGSPPSILILADFLPKNG